MKDGVILFKIYKLESIDENVIMIIYESFLFEKKNKCYRHIDIQTTTTEVHLSGAP
jgi:hypothetical protein